MTTKQKITRDLVLEALLALKTRIDMLEGWVKDAERHGGSQELSESLTKAREAYDAFLNFHAEG